MPVLAWFYGIVIPKAMEMVQEWMAMHKDNLMEIWQTQQFRKLPPLE